MADNVTADPGTGGAVFATDDDGAAHHPYTKIEWGADNTQTPVTTGASSLPVQGAAADNAAAAGNPVLAGGIYEATPGTLGDGDAGSIRLDSNGAVHINDGGNTITVDGTVTANPASGTIDTVTTVGTVTTITNDVGADIQLAGTAVTAGAGAVAAGTPRVTLASDDPGVALLGTIDADTNAIKTAVEGTLTVGSHAVTNAGTFAVQVDGDALTALQLIDDAVHVDDAAFTLGSSKGVMLMGFAGTQSVDANDAAALACDTDGALHISDGGNTITVDGTVTANLSTTDNTVLDNIQTSVDTLAAAVSTEMQVDVVTSALPSGAATAANQLPATSGGISTVFRDEDIDETAVACKASAGQVYWIHCINLDATPVYLHFYDVAAGSTTPGTTPELMSFAVPSQGTANGAGFTMHFNHGIEFSTAITVACTTTIGGTAGPAANEVILNVGYE